ncbi:RidA family protein [Erysipelothrix urinaevulpis]|uniref:RidA family protein n=1 Tax=Erysipelothrix urinaevulpis TaxID=2683717 RepID=UPI00135BB5E0|nr:RidA family protein [Erysipelothrix urinaevulpis]
MKTSYYTPNAPEAVGPYEQACASNGFLFTSGQLGIDPKTKQFVDGIEAQTHQVMKNIQAILEQAGSSLDDILKTTIYLTDMDDFGVVNEVYASYFTESVPARSAFQVVALPLNGLIEIEVIANQ